MIDHLWVCSCGVETDCTFDDMKIGGYFQCPKCGESAVGLVSKGGRKVFIKLDRDSVEFSRLFVDPLKSIVHEALDNATDNGELDWVTGTSDEEVARDMLDKCADVEGEAESELIPHIKSWRDKR